MLRCSSETFLNETENHDLSALLSVSLDCCPFDLTGPKRHLNPARHRGHDPRGHKKRCGEIGTHYACSRYGRIARNNGATALADAFLDYDGNVEGAFQEYDRRLRPFVEKVQVDAINFGLEMFAPRKEEAIRERNARFAGSGIDFG